MEKYNKKEKELKLWPLTVAAFIALAACAACWIKIAII
jgi:hypothetical protein